MNFEIVKKNLEGKGYAVSCFGTASEAAQYLDGCIDGKTVGIGGSATVGQMGLYEKLAAHNQVSWHGAMPQGKTDHEVRMSARASQVYISSVNGLAQTGEIINIDGLCNRVSETLYGHEKVYLVVGKNKLAEDYDKALWRARNVAAPKNAQRLGMDTPCAEKGDRCYDCKSPQRICKALVVFWEKPLRNDIEVVLIDEKLGF